MCVAHPLNDYYDRETDKTLRPETPIARDELTLNEVKFIIVLHYAITIILIAVLPPNWACRTFAILGLIITFIYSAPPIRTAGRSFFGGLTISSGIV